MKRLRIGLLLLAMAGMAAWLFNHQANKVSRHEDEWRNATGRAITQKGGVG